MHSNPTTNHEAQDRGVANLDPRTRILLALGFIVTLSILPPGELFFYTLLLAVLYGTAYFSGCSPIFLLRRSIIALPFALAAVTLLFTVPGETLWTLPLIEIDITVEGVTRFASVLVKSWISVQAAILLVTLTTLPDLLWGLQALRTPTILVTIAGFTYRYLDVLRNEASRLRTARKARSATIAGQPGGGNVQWRARVTGWMVGSLMTRSIERSERIYNAMLARGYQGEIRTLTQFKIKSTDRMILAIASLVYLMTISIAYIS